MPRASIARCDERLREAAGQAPSPPARRPRCWAPRRPGSSRRRQCCARLVRASSRPRWRKACRRRQASCGGTATTRASAWLDLRERRLRGIAAELAADPRGRRPLPGLRQPRAPGARGTGPRRRRRGSRTGGRSTASGRAGGPRRAARRSSPSALALAAAAAGRPARRIPTRRRACGGPRARRRRGPAAGARVARLETAAAPPSRSARSRPSAAEPRGRGDARPRLRRARRLEDRLAGSAPARGRRAAGHPSVAARRAAVAAGGGGCRGAAGRPGRGPRGHRTPCEVTRPRRAAAEDAGFPDLEAACAAAMPRATRWSSWNASAPGTSGSRPSSAQPWRTPALVAAAAAPPAGRVRCPSPPTSPGRTTRRRPQPSTGA